MSIKDTIQGNDWVERMLDLYDEGRDDYEVCRELKITIRQFEDYRAQSKAFCDLVERGRDYSKAFWMKFNRLAAQKKLDASADLVKFNMVNRHGWGNRTEVGKEAPAHMDRQKIEDELRKVMPDLQERLSRGETLESLSRKTLNESAAKH